MNNKLIVQCAQCGAYLERKVASMYRWTFVCVEPCEKCMDEANRAGVAMGKVLVQNRDEGHVAG